MIETHIARRYLWTARKRAHTAFLSSISMLGLAVGVAVLLFSLALMAGLQGQIKKRLIASSPQLLIEPAGAPTIDNAAAIETAARRLGLSDIRPLVTGIGWGANDRERRGRPMRIRSGTARELHSDNEIAVTRDFAAAISLDIGETITVVAPRTRLTPFGPMPVWRKYRIARLDINAATVEEFKVPYQDSAAGVHSTFPAPDGSVWFAEQGSNRLGKWDPVTRQTSEFIDADGGGKVTVRVNAQGDV